MNKLYKFLICCLPLLLLSTEHFEKPQKQVLRVNFLDGAPKFLHPHLVSDSKGVIMCKALFEGLTCFNQYGKIELAIARKIKISKCKTKYTIYLRPTKWSNGKELTASHFVDAWKAGITPGTKCTRSSRFFIIKNAEKAFRGELPTKEVGIYAPKKYQIVIHLEHPVPYLTQLLADPLFSPLFNTYDMKIPICNGPFIVKQFQPGKIIQLKKNPLYWDSKIVRIDGVDISLVEDTMTAYKLFQKGKLDYIGSPLSDLPEEIMQKSKQLKMKNAYLPYWIHLNLENPKLQSKKIRKALNLAVNREHIAKYILPNANPNYNTLPKGLSYLKIDPNQTSIKDIQKLFDEGIKELNFKKQDYTIELSSPCIPRNKGIKFQKARLYN